jgi:hypothetical protein
VESGRGRVGVSTSFPRNVSSSHISIQTEQGCTAGTAELSEDFFQDNVDVDSEDDELEGGAINLDSVR